MRIWGKVLLAVTLFGSGLGIGTLVTTNADGLVDPKAPGTAHDPIVTKSYVDEAIKKLTGQALPGGSNQESSSGSNPVINVQLKSGQRLIAGAGTEFIVRSGKAVAISSDTNGIPDLTEGVDIRPGKVIPLNHLLLFPREGRGIQPQDDKDTKIIHVMIRGSYSHWDQDGTLLSD